MHHTRLIVSVLLLLFSAALPAAGPAPFEFWKEIRIDGVVDNDLYLAGKRIDILAIARGDIVAAAEKISIDNEVSGDIIAAGGRIDIGARVFDDVRAAGGKILVRGAIDGDLVAAGGNLLLRETATVGGRAWLAGGQVSIDGDIGTELRAAGGEITLGGLVDGDVLLYAETIRILPGARISGKLDYYSSRPAEIAAGARIDGTVTHFPVEEHAEDDGPPVAFGALLTLLVTGIVLFLLFPRFAADTAHTLGTRPFASAGLGLAMIFATPPVILLLMVTMIGIVLAMILSGLYLLLLLAGFLTGMLYLGGLLLRLHRRAEAPSRGRRVLSLAAAFLLLWAAGFLPVIDGLLVLLVMLTGVGALTLRLYQGYRATPR